MKNRELKEWLERHVDGISITDEVENNHYREIDGYGYGRTE